MESNHHHKKFRSFGAVNGSLLTPELTFDKAPEGLELQDNEVHIFHATLDLPADKQQCLAETLSPDERNRANRFKSDFARHRFISGRGILREILGWLLRTPPRDISFCYGFRGKPSLRGQAKEWRLDFNVSHSGALAVYAVSRNSEVGIDVEHIRPVKRARHLVANFFSPDENGRWSTLPTDQKSEYFIKCWTRKEAYLKAMGIGISGLRNLIEVRAAPEREAELLELEGGLRMMPDGWFYPVQTSPGYTCGVVTKSRQERMVNWTWNRDGQADQDSASSSHEAPLAAAPRPKRQTESVALRMT
jgi:4'-phosphopantetheinyl transferase